MSYRLIDSNALAQTHPEVNDMPCIYANLDCLNGRFYDLREPSTLQDENAKLRSAVRKMHSHIKETCDTCDCEYCTEYDEKDGCCVYDLFLKEFGIEA